MRTDCGDRASVEALMARTGELFGAVRVLYNNASVFLAQDQPATSLDEAVWDRVVYVNLKSVFLCCKYAIPRIVQAGGGSVINTGSSAAVIERDDENIRSALAENERLRERLEQENVYLREQVTLKHQHGRIVGKSQALQKVLSEAGVTGRNAPASRRGHGATATRNRIANRAKK